MFASFIAPPRTPGKPPRSPKGTLKGRLPGQPTHKESRPCPWLT